MGKKGLGSKSSGGPLQSPEARARMDSGAERKNATPPRAPLAVIKLAAQLAVRLAVQPAPLWSCARSRGKACRHAAQSWPGSWLGTLPGQRPLGRRRLRAQSSSTQLSRAHFFITSQRGWQPFWHQSLRHECGQCFAVTLRWKYGKRITDVKIKN